MAPAAEATYSFVTNSDAAQYQRVAMKIETRGELKLNSNGKELTRKPIEVVAEYQYEELLPAKPRATARQPAPAATAARQSSSEPSPAAVRYYQQAQAKIDLNGKQFTSTLSADHPLIALHDNGDQLICYSPHGPLTRDELDLLDTPGHSGILTRLLPKEKTAIGGEWRIEPDALTRLLNLEAITDAKVAGKLAKVEDTTAILQLSGPIEGAIGGIATEIELTGKLNFDLQQRRITWLVLGLKENRPVGHAEPGFETTTQVRVTIRPAEEPQHLTKKNLAGLPLKYEPTSGLLQFESTAGGYRALLDRRWRMMVDRPDLTVLRWVERGDLIAQCNLSRLPLLAPGKQLSLEEFQDDIRQSLDKNFRQFVEASQSVTEDGLRILRVVAAGEASELAVQWNYYHVSDEAGRRLALVFTLEANLAERFAENDRSLVSSLELKGEARGAGDEPTAPERTTPAEPGRSPTSEPTATTTRRDKTSSTRK